MRVIGLTGGIASGKSTVSNIFKASGVPVVDADLIARAVVQKGTGGWKKVVAAFGNDILLQSGEIDRACLGQIVFSDPEKRLLLNRLLAPYISSGIFWEILKLWFKGAKVIVLDIPLLFEAKMDLWTKPIIVVWVDPETQLKRLIARDGISEEQARNRVGAQTSLEWKKGKADIVIDNSGSIEDTREQFQKVLVQTSKRLSWREYSFSRNGVAWILVSITIVGTSDSPNNNKKKRDIKKKRTKAPVSDSEESYVSTGRGSEMSHGMQSFTPSTPPPTILNYRAAKRRKGVPHRAPFGSFIIEF